MQILGLQLTQIATAFAATKSQQDLLSHRPKLFWLELNASRANDESFPVDRLKRLEPLVVEPRAVQSRQRTGSN